MEITKEMLDEFNNSKLGKYMRLRNKVEVSEEVKNQLKQKYNKDIIGIQNIEPGLLTNEQSEELKNINEYIFSNVDEIKECFLKKGIDAEILQDDEMRKELIRVIDQFEIKKMNIWDVNSTTDLRGINVETLKLSNYYEAVDLSKLKLNEISNLRNLEISFKETIETLKSLENLQLENLKIYNPKVSLELFKNLINLPNLKKLDVSIDEKENITDPTFILDATNLENLNCNDALINTFLKMPIIKNQEELEKLANLKMFQDEMKISARSEYDFQRTEVKYIGAEPIKPEILEKYDGIDFIVSSPLVFDEEFCSKYNKKENMRLRVENDNLEDYSVEELSVINTKIKEILEGVPNVDNDFEKVAYIYKTVGEMAFYDNSGVKDLPEYNPNRVYITRSLKGVLIENATVCLGYALALNKLLDKIGIENNIVCGEALDLDGNSIGGHAWNQVKIEDKWYNCDLTPDSDDIRANQQLRFFLLDDKEFSKRHKSDYTKVSLSDFKIENGFDYKNFYSNIYKDYKNIFECNESYDQSKIAGYFSGEKEQPQTSKQMIRQAGASIAIHEINEIENSIESSAKEVNEETKEEIGEEK